MGATVVDRGVNFSLFSRTATNVKLLLFDQERQRIRVNRMLGEANNACHGVKLNQPDWSESSHCIVFGGDSYRVVERSVGMLYALTDHGANVQTPT
ncbi:hypothetical protein [Stieleria neptunia]|uniref:hypothetical protein n=1 Tax=Stieleria neptunia TaxID=2527979 RepID=UPI0018D231AD|nr:hypothetical protein [Stieleria neptunia]